MKITKGQLRRLIRESLGDEFGPGGADDNRPWGSYAEKSGADYSDVITMSPNADSILVDGRETYIRSAPDQLEASSGVPMLPDTADALIAELERQWESGYVELGVEYKDGKWSW